MTRGSSNGKKSPGGAVQRGVARVGRLWAVDLRCRRHDFLSRPVAFCNGEKTWKKKRLRLDIIITFNHWENLSIGRTVHIINRTWLIQKLVIKKLNRRKRLHFTKILRIRKKHTRFRVPQVDPLSNEAHTVWQLHIYHYKFQYNLQLCFTVIYIIIRKTKLTTCVLFY